MEYIDYAHTYAFMYRYLISYYSYEDANTQKCIIGLISRISKAYKSAGKQGSFILDLMKIDIPNLLRVNGKSDPSVDHSFIKTVCEFIQMYSLREDILGQIPKIMVSMYICSKDKIIHIAMHNIGI